MRWQIERRFWWGLSTTWASISQSTYLPIFVACAVLMLFLPSSARSNTYQIESTSWQAVVEVLEKSRIGSMALIVGNESGIVYRYDKGEFGMDTTHPIASASKMLSSVVILMLVEQGKLGLNDHPQQYISWWTDDSQDPRAQITLQHLLSFTAGFDVKPVARHCVLKKKISLKNCVKELYSDGLAFAPGERYFYGPAHLHVAALMAQNATGKNWHHLLEENIIQPLALQNTAYLEPSLTNPRISGGATSTANEYSRFLQALFSGKLLGNMDVLSVDRTAAPVVMESRPRAFKPLDVDWHYGFGLWRECPMQNWSSYCNNNVMISSPGAFGWYPWIDLQNGYYALLAVEERVGLFRDPAKQSVELGYQLQEKIIAALQASE